MSILFAIIIFEVIIIIHELGHFIAAKSCGVKVNEFAIGMGPAILKKQKGETLYAWRLFPIGGYCAMEGEDNGSEDNKAFCNKSLPRRMIIVIAGVIMNLILGYVILCICNATSDAIATTKISWFEDNAQSQATGLEIGDEIVEINGMRIFTTMDMSYQFGNDEDGTFDMVVKRNGEKVELKDVSFATTDKTMHIDFKVEPQAITVGSVLSQSFKQTCTDGRLIYISFFDLIRGKYSLKDLSGPVGIVDTIDNVIDSERDEASGKIDWASLADTMMTLAAFITINIGIFNLLPLPALDGGRLIFLIIEAIRRKPVKPEHEGMVHAIGLAALLLLMVVVTVSDIIKLV
ncbi:site-2 protease family protein [Ruminococcus sp.]|uniref:M50 family metallopeptidase n=1 Tax=Ruminococcus sp. TaxID=41978 RepID=UPI0025FE89E6|nr:site-2 protease family protein [Ruminococcus sp.]